MANGELAVQHIDSLGAFWPGLQVLAGDVESAIKAHLVCRWFVPPPRISYQSLRFNWS